MARPTGQVYSELEQAYDHFNRTLFNGELPDVVITLQRKKGAKGYCSRLRFASRGSADLRATEIAMNPAYFGIRTIRETLSTLTHEQVHLWQYTYGEPGRRGYHNREWADKMESIGLMPSTTGQPGGGRTGERVTHYIMDDGPFSRACDDLLTAGYTLSWFDRYAPPEYMAALRESQQHDKPETSPEELPAPAQEQTTSTVLIDGPDGAQVEGADGPPKTYKTKYTCPKCKSNAWGKPTLKLICGNCSVPFKAS